MNSNTLYNVEKEHTLSIKNLSINSKNSTGQEEKRVNSNEHM